MRDILILSDVLVETLKYSLLENVFCWNSFEVLTKIRFSSIKLKRGKLNLYNLLVDSLRLLNHKIHLFEGLIFLGDVHQSWVLHVLLTDLDEIVIL